MLRKLITKTVDALPDCMYEKTKCKYICPRYWILTRLGWKQLWNKALWILCVKELKRRYGNGKG